MYKFIDLFCGIGGFRKALEAKGLECVFSSDIDNDGMDANDKKELINGFE
ncbi:DNA cytosine methyltransferase [Rickettsia felis]|nr:DNA cytosine methyltransferase [Rickettsia felis]